MTNNDRELLADAIAKRFIPFAFTCECQGEHPECRDVRTDARSITQYSTVLRIVGWIQDGAE
jgi:hypothetical protein